MEIAPAAPCAAGLELEGYVGDFGPLLNESGEPRVVLIGARIEMNRARQAFIGGFVPRPGDALHIVEIVVARDIGEEAVVRRRDQLDAKIGERLENVTAPRAQAPPPFDGLIASAADQHDACGALDTEGCFDFGAVLVAEIAAATAIELMQWERDDRNVKQFGASVAVKDIGDVFRQVRRQARRGARDIGKVETINLAVEFDIAVEVAGANGVALAGVSAAIAKAIEIPLLFMHAAAQGPVGAAHATQRQLVHLGVIPAATLTSEIAALALGMKWFGYSQNPISTVWLRT